MKKFLTIALAIILSMSTLALIAFAAEPTLKDDTVAYSMNGELVLEFTTVKEAVDSVAAGKAEIIVVKDITLDTAIVLDKDVEIVLKAKEAVTITATAVDAFTVKKGALTLGENLTVNSNTSVLYAEGGKIIVDGASVSSTDQVACAWKNGNITVESGVISSTGNNKLAIYALDAGSSVVVNGGQVLATDCTAIRVKNGATATITGGHMETSCVEPKYVAVNAAGTGSKITVTGGVIKAAGGAALCASESSTVELNGGELYGGFGTSNDTSVAIITGGTVYGQAINNGAVTITGGTFDTLEVLDNLGENAEVTIVLDGEVTLSEALVITDNVTIKGSENGATITATAVDVFTVKKGTLTLGENLTVNSNTSILYANGGDIVVDGAVLNAVNAKYNLAFVDAGSIEVKSGSLNQSGNDKVTVDATGTNASVIVSGGTIYSENSSAVCVREGATLTITDGLVKTDVIDPNRFAAYSWNSGKIIMTGGEVSAANDNGLGAAANGIIVVNDGTVDGITATGAGAEITITGGVVTDAVKKEAEEATITITGGTFSCDVSEFLTGDYVQNEDGSVTIPTFEVVVSTNGGGNATTEKQAYPKGETVEVIISHKYGYSFEKMDVVDIFGNPVEVEGTTFVMPEYPVEVYVTFRKVLPKAAKITLTADIEAEGNFKYQLSYLHNGEEIVIETIKNPESGEIEFAPLLSYAPSVYTFYIKQIADDETVKTSFEITAKVAYGKDGYLAATLSDNNVVFAK